MTSEPDWLTEPHRSSYPAAVEQRDGCIVLTNGLIARAFAQGPGGSTIAFDDLMSTSSLLRSTAPEAIIEIDGRRRPVGGMTGAPIGNYLSPDWVRELEPVDGAFQLIDVEEGETQERFAWRPRPEWTPGAVGAWPPPGRRLRLRFGLPAHQDGDDSGRACSSVTVDVVYQMYDGAPILDKTVVIRNDGDHPVRLGAATIERLAVVDDPPLLPGAATAAWAHLAPLHVETEMAYGGSMDPVIDNPLVRWRPDPEYARTGVNGGEAARVSLLDVGLDLGVELEPGRELRLPTVVEVVYGATDRERRALTRKRMYRLLAPWTAENPLIQHVRSTDPEIVRAAIDQAADVGFDLVILSFGSGLSMEDDSPENIAAMKALADYAHERGVGLGGYSLLASRRISDDDDVIDPETGRPDEHARFLASPCLGSRWGIDHLARVRRFLEGTGFDNLEHDGSYPGDVCASTSHPGHRGAEDSVWTQWNAVAELYRWARSRGMYLTVPDWYFLAGSNRTGMGYVETNWSLPRAQQEIIERQNIYDGTWTKAPSMGWMHVPLEEYHGGGADATIEPLEEHLDHYGRRLAALLSSGVTGVFRGAALYDTEKTRQVVRRWVGFYREHAELLAADVVHVRRPDARDIDALCHVLPGSAVPALVVVHNPLASPVDRMLRVPVHLAGLEGEVEIRQGDGEGWTSLVADPRGVLSLPIALEGRAIGWYAIRARR